MKLTKIIVWVALCVSAFTLMLVVLITYPDRSKPTTPPIIGVCVSYDVNTVGTYVDSPTINNGVVSCATGVFVPVYPQPPKQGA